MSLDPTSLEQVHAQMAALRAHVPTQHISSITATDGANVFAGSNTTNNINIGNLAELLPCATNAAFNASGKENDPLCLPNTRVEVLEHIRAWADGDDERHIFWLRGWAGTGKSTIARTVAREYYDADRWIASFFFSRGGGDVSHAGKFASTIAMQLANKSPDFKDLVQKAISKDEGIVQRVVADQWKELIVEPLSKLQAGSLQSSLFIVIDALDECDESEIGHVFQLLANTRGFDGVRLRVFVTSRPEIPIRNGFTRLLGNKHHDLVLHNISELVVDRDIAMFLRHSLPMISTEERIIGQLVQKAAGLFIWAATACRFIREGRKRQVIQNRLSSVIQRGGSVAEPEKHLDEIYITVLEHSIPAEFSDEEREGFLGTLRSILGSVAVLFSPLSAHSLSKLLDITKEDIDEALEDLHAILDIPEGVHPLRLHHPSFRDFLLDDKRCGDRNFFVDEKQAHSALADHCIRLMSTTLKQDICELNVPGVLLTDVEGSQVQKSLPPESQYACLYWVQHLQKSGSKIYDNDRVHQFLQAHILHWLESLSWMQKISEGIHAIISLGSIALGSNCPQFREFIQDVKRFAQYNRPVMEQAPLQIYLSAVLFAPTRSVIRKQFKDLALQWIKPLPDIREDWSALLQTLEGHASSVNDIAFTPDGKMLASASNDATVRLWDPTTGQCLQILKGHTFSVNAITFTLDGKMLASASDDRTVRLWDPTGQCVQILKGHTLSVNAITFTLDGKMLASASADKTIRLWDPTGQCLQTLKGHTDRVRAIAFTPDTKIMASASNDATVRLWDPTTGKCIYTLNVRAYLVNAIAFTPDGKMLASASTNETVQLWDPTTGQRLHMFERGQAFPNPATRQILRTREGHTNLVRAIAFTPDSKIMASASDDSTVLLWYLTTRQYLQTFEGHTGHIHAIAFTPDGKMLASGSYKTIWLWDPTTGQCLQILEGHTGWIFAMAFTPDGKMLASGSSDETVRLWDPTTGQCLQTLKGHTDRVHAIAFTPDGKMLASASDDKTVRLWDPITGQCLQLLSGISKVETLTFSIDNQYLYTNRGILMLHSDPPGIPCDQQQPAYALSVNDMWITQHDQNLLWLPSEYRAPECTAIHDNNIALGYKSGKVKLFAFTYS